MKRAIWWIKRDFRLSDNQVLTKALAECDAVLPVFVFETALIAPPDYSPMHVWAWQTALKDLRAKAQTLNGDVFINTGEINAIFEQLKTNYNFTHIYSHEETGNNWTYQRDKQLTQWCKKNKIYWTEYPQTGVIRGLKNRSHREPIIAERLFKYENDALKLKAWIEGKTGFPMVDACMRCLQSTRFLNFRMRSMIVSFAVFGLPLDWRIIRDPLARVFLDYEPGIHYSQLQMQAGIVGINTIRVYSPQKQIEDQDPQCKFIKTWVPELRDSTANEIKAHEQHPIEGYVRPIVDFKSQVKAMKDQVFTIRKSLEGKSNSRKVLIKHGSRFKQKARPKKEKPNLQLKLFE